MNQNDDRYSRYHLVGEMYEAADYIHGFKTESLSGFINESPGNLPLMLTGEGSSRIFPGKNAVHRRLTLSKGPVVMTESSTDLAGKKLDDFVVIGASNSGKTKELVNLFRGLKNSGHENLFGLTCNPDSLLGKLTRHTILIKAGPEKAVAATKSVVAQALIYDALLVNWYNNFNLNPGELSGHFENALSSSIDDDIIEAVSGARMVYFAGNNNGVAEELALKTNEIIRKNSCFLPGTYLLHGVEEVISDRDVIVMVDAYPGEFEKITSIYSDSIGATVIVMSSDPTPFHTVSLPSVIPFHEPYIKLAAGWNLLVEAGIRLGIDLDKPERARKIGNEAEN
jgi:glutamine---fructose-6-phosphate transaminase (isomerizing)